MASAWAGSLRGIRKAPGNVAQGPSTAIRPSQKPRREQTVETSQAGGSSYQQSSPQTFTHLPSWQGGGPKAPAQPLDRSPSLEGRGHQAGTRDDGRRLRQSSEGKRKIAVRDEPHLQG